MEDALYLGLQTFLPEIRREKLIPKRLYLPPYRNLFAVAEVQSSFKTLLELN